MSGPKWLPNDDQFIRDYWRVMTDEQLAAFLGRPLRSVEKRRVEMNLCRKRPVKAKEVRAVKDNPELRDRDFDDLGMTARRVQYLRSEYIRHA